MLYTPHYNLNLPEGTDIVNPLVNDNPNYSAIDAAMYANKQGSIGSATEITSGTVHAITRSNPDSNYIAFVATSDWTTGDTMTVDGVTVSVYLSDGTAPKTGAYIINTEVMMILSGSRATLITSKGDTTSIPATGVTYNNASSGLASTNVQGAIDELSPEFVQVVADGIKSMAQLLNELGQAADFTKVNIKAHLEYIGGKYHTNYCVYRHYDQIIQFMGVYPSSQKLSSHYAVVNQNSNGTYAIVDADGTTDRSSEVPSAGTILKLWYR